MLKHAIRYIIPTERVDMHWSFLYFYYSLHCMLVACALIKIMRVTYIQGMCQTTSFPTDPPLHTLTMLMLTILHKVIFSVSEKKFLKEFFHKEKKSVCVQSIC